MSHASKTRQEITQKRAKIAHLKEFVTSNQLFAFQNMEAGNFASASEKFGEMADNCAQITLLEESIQQLRFDLERILEEQSELTLSPVS